MNSPPSPLVSLDNATALAVVDAVAPLLGIDVEPAWREAVAANLKATSAAAKLVLDFPLADELEPAPVFQA